MADRSARTPRQKRRLVPCRLFALLSDGSIRRVFVGRGRLVAYEAVNLVEYAFYIAVTLLFYYMFKPVNRSLSLLAAFFVLMGCANDVLSLLNFALYKISSLVFFGPYCLLIGYLIFKSTFLPRILGVMMAIAGVGWLIFLSPLASHLAPVLRNNSVQL